MIRLLIVDDHDVVRMGLKQVFAGRVDMEVTGEARTGEEAIAQVRSTAFDVALVDLSLSDMSGVDVLNRSKAIRPEMAVLIVSGYPEDQYAINLLKAGASGFVAKSAPVDDVVAAARQSAVSPTSFTAHDLAGAMRRRMLSPQVQLTPRENEILQHLADGVSVAVLAQRLFISQSTAKTHMSKIYEKLGAANRTQAIMAAIRLGLVKAEVARQV